MRTLWSLTSLALATTFLPSPPSHRTPVARHTASAATDTTAIRLTPDLLQRVATFMAQVQQDPAHLRTLAADPANYAHVPRLVGPFRGIRENRLGARTEEGVRLDMARLSWCGDYAGVRKSTDAEDILLDFGAIAAKDPVVAAAFQHANLAPSQYLPFATALRRAEATDALEIWYLDERLIWVESVDSATNVIWQNVAFLRAHRTAIDALDLRFPSTMDALLERCQHGREGLLSYLDTMQHPARIHMVDHKRDPYRTMPEPWPIGFLDSTEAPSPTTAAPLRVLFVGDVQTYYNNLPKLFSSLAAQGLHRRIVVGLVSDWGVASLSLWAAVDARHIIAALPWDVVVVQLRPNEHDRITQRTFPYYAQLYTQAITAHHAQAVLWTRYIAPHGQVAWQTRLDSTLTAAAKTAGATVAPIGQAWEAVQQRGADSTLQVRDLYYPAWIGAPSQRGSYLMALVLYRTITGQSPVGLPRTAHGLSIGPLHAQITDSLSIPAQTAELLQHVAATTRP